MALAFGATGVLGLGEDWELQSTSPTVNRTRAEATGDEGDVIAATEHNAITGGSETYVYIGAETAFVAAIEAGSAWCGNVMQSLYVITSIAIDYSPCASGQRPKVTFTYRDGPTSDCRIYKTDVVLPTYVASSPSVPSLLSVTAGDAECQSSSFSLSCEFGFDLDDGGDYLAGETYKGMESITLNFVGTPTSVTSTGYTSTDSGATTNTAYPTTSFTYVKGVAHYVA